MVSITVENVSKTFGRTRALDGVSLEIEPGETFFLLGPSGCGKTTLIRTLAGFSKPDSGRVLFDGVDVTKLAPHKRQAAMMFQSYALWPHMNVAKNIAFGLEQLKLPKEEIEERVESLLAMVHLQGLEERPINALSGGQQQRVALARALAVRPNCLLLDEPLSNLDASLRLEMRNEIKELCQDHGLTTIYVTHDQKEALSVASRIAILDQGRLVQVGKPHEVYRRPRTCDVARFMGEANFIGARLKRVNGSQADVDTDHGRFRGFIADPNWHPEPGTLVIVALRPEALRMRTTPKGPNNIDGFVEYSTYLGETAQHALRASDGSILRLSELNPSGRSPSDYRSWYHAIAHPADVVILQAPEGMVESL